MSSSPKLEPIVRQYVCSDANIRAILGTITPTPGSIEEAMILLRDFINGKQSANGAFLSARNVDIHGLDTNLCILFLASWAHACFIQSAIIEEKRSAAWTLVHRARSLTSKQTPLEVSSYVDLIEARLVGSEGNRVQQEQIIKNTLSTLPQDSPRRKFVILELATLLSQSGRINDIQMEINNLAGLYTNYFKKDWITALQFVNRVETGQLSKASSLIPEIAASDANSYAIRQFKTYRTLLELMRDDPGAEVARNATVVNESDLPDWALVIQCLITGSLHQALRWARLCEKKRPVSITGQECTSFNLIRAELAEGNSEAARRIIDMRHSHGNIHYLDDLFQARIQWLDGNRDTAVEHFAKVLKASDKYKASGRLNFELRLSAEMPRDAILNMTRTSEISTIAPGIPKREVKTLPPSAEDDSKGLNRIIGSSLSIESVRETIMNFAPLEVPVLITGETGTGKELVAQALHEVSPRWREPFVAINCGAISESLLESELFGHEKGAFSGAASAHQGLFEEAGRGTIFLDEIGEISPRLQVVLLRVLETNEIRPVGSSKSRKINCRILASTNTDLEQLTKENRFRRDVLFRLRRLEIHLPPLRDREDDIVNLAEHFLNSGRGTGNNASLSEGLQRTIHAYPWPGNVRELRNTIERMRLMNSDKLHYDINDIDIAPPQHTEIPYPGIAPVAARILHVQNKDHPPQTSVIPDARPARPVRLLLQRGKSRIRRIILIRNLFTRHELLTRSEIVKTLDISPNTATHDLKTLCNEGFIERVKPTASPRSVYFVLKESNAGNQKIWDLGRSRMDSGSLD